MSTESPWSSPGAPPTAFAPSPKGARLLLPDCPYQGLMPFSEDDAPFFFGRERERSLIIGNLRTARLTILYGTSGVGKSSVLRAGVAETLRRQSLERLAEPPLPDEDPTPGSIVVVFSSWREHPVQRFVQRVEDSVRLVLRDATPEPPPYEGDLVATLYEWTRRLNAPLFLVLDQFEEFLLYHGDDISPGSFADQIASVINRAPLPVHTLISIREDALARLDRFKGRIPALFRNYLRLDHLDRNAARHAILRPVQKFNEVAGEERVKVDPDLVDRVLDEVPSGALLNEHEGHGKLVTEAEAVVQRIETPYLQLVMTRLWQESVGTTGRGRITAETFERLGGAERIVSSHLGEVMDGLSDEQRECAARMFSFMVTPSGTKIALSVSDLAAMAELPVERVTETLQRLGRSEAHITRAVESDRHEIFHDVMARQILEWRRRWIDHKEEEQRLRKANRRGAVIAALLLGVVIGSGWWTDRREAAEEEARERPRQVILASLGEFGAPLADAGFTPHSNDRIEIHAMAAGDTLSRTLTLRAGLDWAIVAACDENCGDIDLRLYRGDELVSADTLPDRRPVVQVEGEDGADFRLVASMVDCPESCYAGYRVYRQSPGDYVDARLRENQERWRPLGLDHTPVFGIDALANGDSADHALPPMDSDGGELRILGVCDRHCRDLDLILLRDGEPVSADIDPDDFPIVTVPSYGGDGNYTLRVSMENCLAERCTYGWQVYRARPEDLARALAASAIDPVAARITEGGYWEPMSDVAVVALSGSGSRMPLEELEPGRRHIVLAACGPRCELGSLRLTLLEDGEPRTVATPDADARVMYLEFESRQGAEYALSMGGGGCGSDECYAGWQGFRDLGR